jgi:hypothetical protein
MKKVLIILFALFIGLNVYGQRRRNMNDRIPQTQREPSEQEIEKRKRLMKERKDEYIANFLTTLDADDFQKEIIKQSVNSFYDAKMDILRKHFERNFDREQEIRKLEKVHFVELKALISEGDMTKITKLITGGFDEKEVVKDKKKKKKRKKRKKDKN